MNIILWLYRCRLRLQYYTKRYVFSYYTVRIGVPRTFFFLEMKCAALWKRSKTTDLSVHDNAANCIGRRILSRVTRLAVGPMRARRSACWIQNITVVGVAWSSDRPPSSASRAVDDPRRPIGTRSVVKKKKKNCKAFNRTISIIRYRITPGLTSSSWFFILTVDDTAGQCIL